MGDKRFKSALSPSSVTAKCEKWDTDINGRRIVVVDTPGFFDTNVPEDKSCKEIKTCVKYLYPGIHAIIQVMQLGRFSQEEKAVSQLIEKIFSLKAKAYMIILFTRKDDLEGRPLREFLLKGDADLQKQIAQCGGRCLAFNNKADGQEKDDQVAELLEMIDQMVQRNTAAPNYTEDMLKKDQEAYEKMRREIREELRGEIHAELKKEMLENLICKNSSPCNIL
ncbi:GTPase IMAP family member 7-like isoform X2 [Rhineura floridana]|nr:GTPase IMAP family member 7-like isoform X2 [Rhineura floridana]